VATPLSVGTTICCLVCKVLFQDLWHALPIHSNTTPYISIIQHFH
jgi:hypothetical protein